ncbi:MAG: hypothetical protein JW843_04965 [Candidatus Aminicenantes bacterium]|nr:hypothetical protein [Candidatus Aminicenantes bacterium]
MKIHRLVRIGLAAAFLVAALPAAAQDPVTVEAKVSPLRLSKNQEGKLVLKVGMKKGVNMSALPALTIELEDSEGLVFSKSFFTGSDLALSRVEIDGKECFDLKQPIEIPFKVDPKADRGVYVLRGRVKYFAFKPAEGVCLKSSARFSTSYSTWGIPAREGTPTR